MRTRNDGLHIIWTIALKDIADAIQNKVVLSLVVGLGAMLLMPRMMSLIIDPPYTEIVVYDAGAGDSGAADSGARSRLSSRLEESPLFRVRRARSLEELKQVVGSAGFGLGVEVGLAIPAGFDEALAGEAPELDGYVAWANRSKAHRLRTELERQITELWDGPVRVQTEGHLTYPPSDAGMALGIFLNMPVTMIFTLGTILVPNLLFEEKQTKTMEALLVSPSSIGQVVMGKALAGLFYILVAGGVVLAINWAGIVHWTLAILFVIGIGLFATAVGLVLGSVFARQLEVTGWTTLLIVVFTGAMFINMMDVRIPAFWQTILPWVPSVALVDVLRFAFLERVPWAQVWANLGSVLGISALLYAIVVWKVRRSDR